jgi:hypothetical protein
MNNVKRKLTYAFTEEEIEVSKTKKQCIVPPRVLLVPPIIHSPIYQTDIWSNILSNFDIPYIKKPSFAILLDIKIILTLSETCRYFKYYFDPALMITQLLNMSWGPDIFEYLYDCSQFLSYCDYFKKYGVINKQDVVDYITSLNLRLQYHIIVLIMEIHYMIGIELMQPFLSTLPDYKNYFKSLPKEVIEKKWIHFVSLIPDNLKIFPKTKIMNVNL